MIKGQYGDKGTAVEEIQKMLKANGYNLAVDGSFGPATLQATKDFQRMNGLLIDGIVGEETLAKLQSKTQSGNGTSPLPTQNKTTTTPAPTLKPLPTAPTYDTSKWDDSEKGSAALGDYNTAKDAVNGYGDFTYVNQQQLNDVLKKILNREKFSYDLNGDALYQQYKDKYIQQGKMAMGDAIGQASAMTGGYGNSYAQSVGQQAYQAQLQNLNDIVPELYQMAYDKYNQEGQDLYNQYGMLSDDYTREYGVWNDKYGRLMDALGIARGDYYDGADMFYTEQTNKNSIANQEFNDAMSIWNSESYNAWKQAEWDEAIRQRAEDIAYRDSRDKIEDEQWQKQFDAQYGNKSGGVVDGDDVDDKTGGSYNNGSLTSSQIKELQQALGVDADGKYGPASQKAAGGLSAEEAYKKFVTNGTALEAEKARYANWDAGEWQSYFAQIRQTEGKAAAEQELQYFTSRGLIPKNMTTYAAIGARGSLGH